MKCRKPYPPLPTQEEMMACISCFYSCRVRRMGLRYISTRRGQAFGACVMTHRMTSVDTRTAGGRRRWSPHRAPAVHSLYSIALQYEYGTVPYSSPSRRRRRINAPCARTNTTRSFRGASICTSTQYRYATIGVSRFQQPFRT